MMDRSELESMRRVLPLPIAQAMGRALESIHPAEQIKEWRMTMDVLISYVNAIVSSEYCAGQPVAKVDEKLRQDPQQTDSGRGIIQLGSTFKRMNGKRTLFCEPFRKWFYSELELQGETLTVCEHLNRLVTLRNKDTHARLSKHTIEQFIDACVAVIKRCVALRQYHLFVVRQQSPTPVGSTGQVSMLMGENPSSTFSVHWQGMTLLTDGVYLLSSGQDEILYLSPFLLWMEDVDVRRNTVFVWRLIKKGRLIYQSSLSNREESRWISVYGSNMEEEYSWEEWLDERPLTQHLILDSGHLDWSPTSLEHVVEALVEEEESEEETSTISFAGLKVVLILFVLTGGWIGLNWNQMSEYAVFPIPTTESEELTLGSDHSTGSEMISFNISMSPLRSEATLWVNGLEVESNTEVSVAVLPVSVEVRIGNRVCHFEEYSEDLPEIVQVNWQCSGLANLDMVSVEAGIFQFGAKNDTHRHTVEISHNLLAMSTEVTQQIWDTVMKSGGVTCPECPKVGVSWLDAIEFANRLSEFEGLPTCFIGTEFMGLDCEGYRLPTEAEWEFLAKAGTEQLFAGANSPAGVAIFEWNSDDRLSPVGQKRPNQWGLYDMSGNAFEWCLDDFVEEPVRQLDPLYILDSTRKVGRGGSFRSKEEAIRSTSRSSAAMDVQTDFIGFRLVRTDLK